ncbi:MAG: hypothetical protein JWR24_5373 [Actinoallomurus sp.]|jgi:hypothetical protein|nr:hypothetical protein [Actinoallomurus sp.]
MRNEQPDWEGTLVEPQGVNAGAPIDEEVASAPDEERLEAGHASMPPDTLMPSGITSDEIVGSPEQVPGYPGQQRSIDTS